MPKVKPEYFDNKRDSILDAAFNVYKRKPLHHITMKDIIRESGVSQGGIYRYYKGIDEILVEVMNRIGSDTDFRQMIEDVLNNSKTPEETVKGLLTLLANYINDNATTLGKFQFEITELVAYEPNRIHSISAQNRHVDSVQYLMNKLFTVIRNGIESRIFMPVLPLNDILCFISISIDGIVLDGVLHKCYGLPEKEYGFDILRLMNTLIQSVLYLLSIDKMCSINNPCSIKLGERYDTEK